MRDRRFRQTEDAILKAVKEEIKEKQEINVMTVVKKAGIAKSTFYHHHETVWAIILDYEEYILRQYQRRVNRLLKRGKVSIKMLYIDMTSFIIINREIFEFFRLCEREKVVKEMLRILKPEIERAAGLPKNSDWAFEVFIGEMAVVIGKWGSMGFYEVEISKTVVDMANLTGTIRGRLGVFFV